MLHLGESVNPREQQVRPVAESRILGAQDTGQITLAKIRVQPMASRWLRTHPSQTQAELQPREANGLSRAPRAQFAKRSLSRWFREQSSVDIFKSRLQSGANLRP